MVAELSSTCLHSLKYQGFLICRILFFPHYLFIILCLLINSTVRSFVAFNIFLSLLFKLVKSQVKQKKVCKITGDVKKKRCARNLRYCPFGWSVRYMDRWMEVASAFNSSGFLVIPMVLDPGGQVEHCYNSKPCVG